MKIIRSKGQYDVWEDRDPEGRQMYSITRRKSDDTVREPRTCIHLTQKVAWDEAAWEDAMWEEERLQYNPHTGRWE